VFLGVADMLTPPIRHGFFIFHINALVFVEVLTRSLLLVSP